MKKKPHVEQQFQLKDWYVEKILAERLQLPLSAIAAFRAGLKKNDWQKSGRQILLSPAAVKKLLSDYDISSSVIQENGEPARPEAIELVIERVFPNPRLILCKVPETGELVRVLVPMNVNFQPRMTIKARPPLKPEGPQLYRLEGRCPRFKGRW
jgi:hypothetical protein